MTYGAMLWQVIKDLKEERRTDKEIIKTLRSGDPVAILASSTHSFALEVMEAAGQVAYNLRDEEPKGEIREAMADEEVKGKYLQNWARQIIP